jgi:hypothetical protein
VKRSLQRDRRPRVRVVVQGLPESDTQQEEQQRDADAEAPADKLLPAAATSALLTLDRREGRHGV